MGIVALGGYEHGHIYIPILDSAKVVIHASLPESEENRCVGYLIPENLA